MNKQELLKLRFYCLQLANTHSLTPEEILGLAMGMEAFLLDGMADEPAVVPAEGAQAD